MKIVYVAKHAQTNSNDDEGAIAHALTTLGHEVILVHEHKASAKVSRYNGDFLLFHKWDDAAKLSQVNIPKVFWYFDLVEYPDPLLESRNDTRRMWMKRTIPLVDLGFCTDGDWVNKNRQSGKLIRLLQGCDQRIAKPGVCSGERINILFTGGHKNAGAGRNEFVQAMKFEYGNRFHQCVSGTHGFQLADLIARSRIVVAPNHPITNHYWSNRVYLSLGFGAFMLHPRCETLLQHYTHEQDIVYYDDMTDLHRKIYHYLNSPKERDRIAEEGYARTINEHTYTHRCQTLIDTVRQRLGI